MRLFFIIYAIEFRIYKTNSCNIEIDNKYSLILFPFKTFISLREVHILQKVYEEIGERVSIKHQRT